MSYFGCLRLSLVQLYARPARVRGRVAWQADEAGEAGGGRVAHV